MNYFLFSIGFLLTIAFLAEGIDREKVKKELHSYRVSSQNLHIDKLYKDLKHLEHDYHNLSPVPSKGRIRELKARIRNLEGDRCEKGHVNCGAPTNECISPLFACDGHKDCHNGRDEDPEICDNTPARVGSTISGITSWVDCINHLPHMTVISITASHQPEAFHAQTYVRAVVSFEVNEHSHLVKTFNAKGYWSPGKRILALGPDQEDDKSAWAGYGVLCKFNLGTYDKADCKIGSVVSKHVCATFRGTRH